jgi:hypothetical protein
MPSCIDFPDSSVQHRSCGVWVCYRGRRENWLRRQDMVHNVGCRLSLLWQERGWHLHAPLCFFEFCTRPMPRCFNLVGKCVASLIRVVRQ